MKTSQIATTQPGVVELDEQDLWKVAGGQFYATATSIFDFGLATGTGGYTTLSGGDLSAHAGTNGIAVIAGAVGSLTYSA